MTVTWGVLSTARISDKFLAADSYRLELENVSGAICGEKELPLGRDDAVGKVRIIDALYRSPEISTPVALTDWSSA